VALGILGFSVELDIEGSLQKHCTAGAAKETGVAIGSQRKLLQVLN
jgi:hypothetical protein